MSSFLYHILLSSIRASARNAIAAVGLLMPATLRERPSKVISPSITRSLKCFEAPRYVVTRAKSKINFEETDSFKGWIF